MNIQFSFWTADIGHGFENIKLSHTLNIISDDDVKTLFEEFKSTNPTNGYEFPIISSKTGNIIAYKSDLFSKEKLNFIDEITRAEAFQKK